MANPSADFPTAVHTPTDVSGFGTQALGTTSPSHTDLEGKQEQELAALGAKIGIGASPASDASTGDVLVKQSNGSTAWDSSLSGKFTLQAANVVNESGADVDQRFEGDTDQNLIFLDASTDRIGIGNAAPAYKFDVTGQIRATKAIRSSTIVIDGDPTAFAQPYTDPSGFAPKGFMYLDSTYGILRIGVQDNSYGAQSIAFELPFNNNYQDVIAMSTGAFAPAAAFNNSIDFGGASNRWKSGYFGTSGLNTSGNLTFATANSKLTAQTGLVLEQTGDTFGTTRLSIQNRNGVNGALFEQAGSVDLVDFVFKSLNYQRNIRFEGRGANVFNSAPEFQIGTPDDPSVVINDSRFISRKGFISEGAVQFNNLQSDVDFRIASQGDANAFFVDASSNRIGIGTATPATKLDIVDDSIRIRTALTPSSATATGNQGEIAWDSGFIYVCTASNTWKRVAIATW